MKLNTVELFCGAAEMSGALKQYGHNTFTVDIRKRKGICEPDLRKDVFDLALSDLPYKKVNFLFAAVPCTAFSYGAGDYYYKDGRPNEKAFYYLKLLKKTLDFIEAVKPDLFIIENPRGHLRYNKLMIDFLCRSFGTVKYITLGSYGFPTVKPTDLFTNFYELKTAALLNYGRGAKGVGTFGKMTICARQRTPVPLALDLAAQLTEYFAGFPAAVAV